ncbi:GNAT family N-acetyltransferase [Robiginitalea sp. M366]|uniref:GNAT family N-acetyltransferase n=1 Tax=Robiginitalea aestuariiviva TaxID=3036903 RepID=UPI00240D010F|nr:GNAT family N-acetyltransferase [Robiginitalea aestuariiviva]MDG1571258.1 GNAT family N-acetyltransferase [Robiginitalea aestuariiviva]
MTDLKPATTPDDCKTLASLADRIWREHYIPIIGKPQVDYMLRTFQSEAAIARQISEGMAYYLIYSGHSPAGYFAFEKQGDDLFLSKIYVAREYRGKGLGKASMAYIREQARLQHCKRITLTVNKDNSDSINAYKRMGFYQEAATIKDIGEGFIMDDYLMVLDLETAGT